MTPNRLSSCPVSLRTTSLNHKSFDNSMENKSIIISFFRQLDEVLTCFGSIINEKFDVNIAHCGLDDYLTLLCCFLFHLLDHNFLFVRSLVDNVSYYTWSQINLTSWENIKSVFPECCTVNCWICTFSLSLRIAWSCRVSHCFALEYCHSHESFMLLQSNYSLNILWADWVEFQSIKRCVNEKLFSLVEICRRIVMNFFRRLQFLFEVHFPFIFVFFQMENVVWVWLCLWNYWQRLKYICDVFPCKYVENSNRSVFKNNANVLPFRTDCDTDRNWIRW